MLTGRWAWRAQSHTLAVSVISKSTAGKSFLGPNESQSQGGESIPLKTVSKNPQWRDAPGLATPPPGSETVPDHKPQSPGSNEGRYELSRSNYLKILRAEIDRHRLYPTLAKARLQSGETDIGFKVLPDGVITEINIQHSSGIESLDAAAILAVKEASGVHAFTPEMKPEPISVLVPIIFTLTR